MSAPVIIYNNILETGTLLATSTDPSSEYDVANLIDWKPFNLWKASSTADQDIILDYGSAVTADSLVLMTHNLFTAGATIKVTNATNSAFTTGVTVVLNDFVVTNNNNLYKPLTVTTPKQFWKISIFNSLSVVPYVSIAALSTGLVFPVPLSNKSDWDPKGYIIKSKTQLSNGGWGLGNVVDRKEITINPFFKQLPASFVEGSFNTFWETHGSILKPFFWIWNPSQYPDIVHLVTIPPEFTKQFPYRDITIYRDITLSMTGVLV